MLHTPLLSHITPDLVEAGADEAGRGCLAGPVVAAAVILPKGYQTEFLNDSKQAEITIRRDALAYTVAEVSNTEIDRINILKASFLAMHRAIAALSITPELLLIDGNRFNPYPNIPHQCIVKGDGKILSIAAASILAKTHRDRLMSALAAQYPQYGWERNAAYPTPEHRAAIAQYGTTPYHRLTFQLLPEKGLF
jgi:ribonuclease HII